MKVNDVLKIVLLYLGYIDEYDLSREDTYNHPDKVLSSLIRCINLVNSELTSDYLPLVTLENVEEINNEILYENLNKPIINILSIKQNGVELMYKALPDRLLLDTSGIVEVVYSYLPEYVNYGDEIEYKSRITARTFALGVCAEYALINNLFEESIAFERRYKDALKIAVRKKSEIRVKARRWI